MIGTGYDYKTNAATSYSFGFLINSGDTGKGCVVNLGTSAAAAAMYYKQSGSSQKNCPAGTLTYNRNNYLLLL